MLSPACAVRLCFPLKLVLIATLKTARIEISVYQLAGADSVNRSSDSFISAVVYDPQVHLRADRCNLEYISLSQITQVIWNGQPPFFTLELVPPHVS